MTLRRITTARVAELEGALGPRDWLLLATVQRVRVITARQAQRVCYPENTPLSGARMARRALRRLVELRVLARLDRTPGGHGGGGAGDVYAVDVAGLRLLERHEPEARPVRRPWPVSRRFLDHALAVTEWYCELVEADRRGAVELLDFTTEPRSWRTFTAPAGGSTTLKPDAFLRLGHGDWETAVFLEVDRDTEGPATLRRQLDLYVRYWRSGTEQARHEVFPLVVWIVPHPRRHVQLVDLLGRLPSSTWPLFRVATEVDALGLLTGLGGEP